MGKINIVFMPTASEFAKQNYEFMQMIDGGDIASQLASMQKLVGGNTEAVDLLRSPDKKQALTMWVNEEGKLLNLPVNPVATSIAWEAGAIGFDDHIRGDAFIAGTDSNGNTISVQAYQLDCLLERVAARLKKVIESNYLAMAANN